MPLSKQKFSSYINEFNFRELFNEMGWNNDNAVVPVSIDTEVFKLQGVAVKSGFKILTLQSENKKIPSKEARKKIHRTISKFFYEHLIIYYDAQKSHQIWQTAIRLPNKPIKIHEVEWSPSQDPEILYQRTSGLFFTFEEEEIITIVDVLKRIQENFNTNSEKVTKKFYERFKKEHGAFYSFIEGIEKESDQRWYASLMLNRLMFIYFIQKKGFLDGDINYLKNKLNNIKELRGDNKFYKSFYKLFLCRLFHEGLGKPHNEDKELIALIGKVPYLNGGLFDVHELEKDNDNLDVKDEAFIRLFDFFDEYNWHLDDRITASGKDINPDVIGYIFEKYINDRASMGAYYTKEDITEYISKNCIIPFLFDRAKENCANAFLPGSSLWQMLKQDPDRYIYDAVKHGISFEKGIRFGLADDIIKGLDAPDSELVETRKAWNKSASANIALPTEIYREVIERRKRYFELRKKIENGEITQINDFITYNLNIRQFAQDVIENYEGSDFVQSFFEAIAGRKYDDKRSGVEPTLGITILDPTCGSGAFLFAALNILEPLYEGCISRMRDFILEDDSHSGKHFRQFRIVLNEIENHPSESYYILKSIILNNLFGVDIMKEAVETAKLRLFLKLVAQTDDFEHVEPLPDIDFNIRCGNTLVGFANWQEVNNITQGAYAATLLKIEDGLDKCKLAYKAFQTAGLENDPTLKDTKKSLNDELKKVNDRLNFFLAKLHRINTENISVYNKWLFTHSPFHWFAEFYEIVHDKGGFDVVIGNPPYVEYSKVKKDYLIKNYETESCGNLYAYVVERILSIINKSGKSGIIVPHSIAATYRAHELQTILLEKVQRLYLSYFTRRPGKLFDGADQCLCIVLSDHSNSINSEKYNSTTYQRWYTEERGYLFEDLAYSSISLKNEWKCFTVFPKVGFDIENSILHKIKNNKILDVQLSKSGEIFYTHRIGRYFIKTINYIPYFWSENEGEKKSDDYKPYFTKHKKFTQIIIAALNSSLFYWFWRLMFDGYHCGKDNIASFPFSFETLDVKTSQSLITLNKELLNDYKKNTKRKRVFYKKSGFVEYDEFDLKLSKSIIDKIDTILASHYGFTAEELDFIINYDIKYRMGKEIDNGENEE